MEFPALANGGFDNGLTGWRAPYRYIADHTPGFIWNASGKPHSGEGSAYLCSHVLGKKWAADELIELYQLVQATPGTSPVLRGAYYIEESNAFSGGYIRVVAYRQKEMIAMMLFDWGKGKEKCKHLPRSFAFTATGARAEHRCLISLGKQHKAMFWNLPADKGTWHPVNLDIRGLYEQALKTQGIEPAFGADTLFLAVGVWNGRGGAENSAARFDDLALTFSRERQPSILDGKQLLTSAQVFETTYALDKSADE
ncbi:MAG: hypothetical protein M1541_20220 [Acidobacteria bacterium]|nr:hypothetical protein [Acidobacteriota bacterium]